MASDDSDDEPLSALIEAKKLNPTAFATATLFEGLPKKKKRKRSKRLPVTIDLVMPSLKKLVVPKPIVRPEDVWLYLKDFNPAGPYSCLLCPEWFINRSKIVVHYMLNHKKDFCGICRYFVPDREAWANHQKFHSSWCCSQCAANFETEGALQLHFKEHKLVYCRFCHFLVPDDEPYAKHLTQKHAISNLSSKDEEFVWVLDPEGTKFDCLLCSKTGIATINFFNHMFCIHHFTLKNFSNMVSGKDTQLFIPGVKISQNFVETQLKDQRICGYVDLDAKRAQFEEMNEIEVPIIKKEIESENEEDTTLADKTDLSDLPEALKSYRGEVDIDITKTELVILQKCSQEYINDTLNNLHSNTIPENSKINYELYKSDFENFTCLVCSNMEDSITSFMAHTAKMHGVKTMPLYSCRVCLNSFTTFEELTTHSQKELGDFQDLWICQFCDKEFDDRELTRRHLTEHFSTIDVDNCFSPHLGFKCRYCPTLFWNEPDREQHQVKVHMDKEVDFYKCGSCAEVFSDRIWFIHHYIESHAREDAPRYVIKCNQCCATLEDLEATRAHFKELHYSMRRVYCDIRPCNFRPVANRGSLKLHLKAAHSASTAAVCAVCGRVFASARARAAHATAAHGRAGFRCKLCGDALCTSDERKLHYMLRHPGRNPFQCGLCPRSFLYKSSLYAHRNDHASSVVHTCGICGKTFMKKDSYREHMAIHSGPRHTCSYCPQRFVQRSNMLRHERRHTGERPYACLYCPRTFSDRGAATSHTRTHTKDRSFPCLYCGQTFVQKSKLNYHVRKHTGENLETCGVCGKLFTSACSLREHMKTHDSTRNTVPCPLCDRKYHNERALIRHIRNSHGAGSSQHKCPLCAKTFSDAAALRAHVPQHATINMFKCKYCPNSYAVKRSMLSHLQRRHKLRSEDPGASVHFTHLDVRDCGLKLDEETITKIFGPRRKVHDVTLADHVTIADQPQPPSSDDENEEVPQSEMVEVTIKMENTSEEELEPTDFVSVKIEPVDENEFIG